MLENLEILEIFFRNIFLEIFLGNYLQKSSLEIIEILATLKILEIFEILEKS